jgi:phosphatidylglycerophosphatase A
MTWWADAWSEWQQKQIRPSKGSILQGGILPGVIVFLSSGFLSGFIPHIPGTAGTLTGLLIYWLLLQRMAPLAFLPLLLSLLLLGSLLCTKAEAYLGKPDAAPIVWDEWVGYWISVALLPPTAWVLWGGFFLFRLFDILKPPPIRRLQSLRGGWGVMVDDLVAGLYANLLLRITLWLTRG